MDYDMNCHVPNQVEALLSHRINGDMHGFEYVLTGIKQLMNDHPLLLDAFENDYKKRNDKHDEIFKKAKKDIETAFKDKTIIDGLNNIKNILNQAEGLYNMVELEFMNDIVTTLSSYDVEEA